MALGEPVPETKKVVDFLKGISAARFENAKTNVDGDPTKQESFHECTQFFKKVNLSSATRTSSNPANVSVVSAPKPSTSTGSKRKKGQKPNAKSKKTLPRIHAGHYAPEDFNALSEEEKAEVKRLRMAKKQASGATKIAAVNTDRNVTLADAKDPPETPVATEPPTPSGTANSSLSSNVTWRDLRKSNANLTSAVVPATTATPVASIVRKSWRDSVKSTPPQVIGTGGVLLGSWRDSSKAAWYQKAVNLSDPPQIVDPDANPPAKDPITAPSVPPPTEDPDAKPSAQDPIILASVSISVPATIPTTTQESAVDPTTAVPPTTSSTCISVASTTATLPTTKKTSLPCEINYSSKPRRKPKVRPPEEPEPSEDGTHEWGTEMYDPRKTSDAYVYRNTTLPAPKKLVECIDYFYQRPEGLSSKGKPRQERGYVFSTDEEEDSDGTVEKSRRRLP
jgi:hypothetical protein